MPLFLIFLIAAVAIAQQPDRNPLPDEWGYRPAENMPVSLNPPAFSWVLEKTAKTYSVQWADNAQFQRPATTDQLPWTVYTHHSPLKPGTWWWRYRMVLANGQATSWSRARKFVVPADAPVLPQPTLDQVKTRIPKDHPRLFVHTDDLDRIRAWTQADGKDVWKRFLKRADDLVNAEPTPEPAVRGNSKDPATRDHWWSNRVLTIKALNEAEVLAFAWLITNEKRYGDASRRFTMKLAQWDPDGPTNFALNCEAAKPMLYRLARAYDWAWPVFTEAERAQIRAVMLRRARDAWKSGEIKEGGGHLNQPYGSHANRIWHKLAENAIATLGETPESDLFLQYAVTKFFAAYPVWSDDDGGWHEGLSYLSGYMTKVVTWIDLAKQMGIEAHLKPFFARLGDYPMYSAPPGSPNLGFGDLSSGQPSGAGWAFLHYFARESKNPYWAWWLNAWELRDEFDEPVLGLLWASRAAMEPKRPADLQSSKVFEGTGVAILNSNLEDGLKNVQLRFKSSPMGRASHGHDPQNSFTLNAYGVPLLVNNVYRDLYGSPFHRGVWETRSQNAVLVNGKGQKVHSMDLGGRIIQSQLSKELDYVAGDATASYEGGLTRAIRHVFFLKPGLIVIADDLAAPEASIFEWMLHAPSEFAADESMQQVRLDQGKARLIVDYVAPDALRFRQWTGYEPDQDYKYLESIKRPPIPPQWHIEATSSSPAKSVFALTVLRIAEGAALSSDRPRTEMTSDGLRLLTQDVIFEFASTGATVKRGGREWRIVYRNPSASSFRASTSSSQRPDRPE